MASIIFLNKCASTNEAIIQYLPDQNKDFLSVYTFNQTKGKGQYGNSWQSGENLNLAFSIAIPANLIKIHDHLFNFHTALVLSNFVDILTNTPVRVKWPNDLIIKNKKVAGMLMEKKMVGNISYFILGIGLNVLQENFENLPKAGSLWTQTRQKFDLTELTRSLNEFLVQNLIIENGENILNKFTSLLFRKDEISVFQTGGSRQNGIIKEVDEDGFLWVELEKDGLKRFYHKEIELLY